MQSFGLFGSAGGLGTSMPSFGTSPPSFGASAPAFGVSAPAFGASSAGFSFPSFGVSSSSGSAAPLQRSAVMQHVMRSSLRCPTVPDSELLQPPCLEVPLRPQPLHPCLALPAAPRHLAACLGHPAQQQQLPTRSEGLTTSSFSCLEANRHRAPQRSTPQVTGPAEVRAGVFTELCRVLFVSECMLTHP